MAVPMLLSVQQLFALRALLGKLLNRFSHSRFLSCFYFVRWYPYAHNAREYACWYTER